MHSSSVREYIGYLVFIAVIAFPVGSLLPRSLFNGNKFPYRLMKWENDGRIYEKLRIRSWKDRVPDMSRLMGVRKRLSKQASVEQIERLVKETCVAEMTHIVLILLGLRFSLIFVDAIAFLLSAVWGFGNLLFIIIQRYNRPTLQKLAVKLRSRGDAVAFGAGERGAAKLTSGGQSI